MSAVNPEQFQQLDMFRPARDLADPSKIQHGDAYQTKGDTTALAEQKVASAGASGLYKGVAHEGVKEPVGVYHLSGWPEYEGATFRNGEFLRNGHHRVFAANDIDPDSEVPIRHHDLPYKV